MESDLSNNELSYYNHYIDSLIENLNSNKFDQTYNLVLDAGVFNGGYMFGSLIFFKQLENKNLININKVSGSSIGAILGLAYLTNNLNLLIVFYNKILLNYKTNHNFSNVINEIIQFINQIYIDFNKINNKLFITYTNVELIVQETVSEFENKEQLIDVLIKTTYIPFLSGTNTFYMNKYMDGLTPYLLKDTDKTIHINLISRKICKDLLFTKNEKNIWTRFMVGVNETNNFFSNKSTFLICEIDNWNLVDYFYFKLRYIILLLIIIFFKIYEVITSYIPISIINNKYLKIIKNQIINIINEIFFLFII